MSLPRGGTDIHVRRAAAELAAGVGSADLKIVQTRPVVAELEGLGELTGMVSLATGGIHFDTVSKALQECRDNYKDYLDEDELSYFDDMDQFDKLTQEIEDSKKRREGARDDLNKNFWQKKIDSDTVKLDDLRYGLEEWDCSRTKLEKWAQTVVKKRLRQPHQRAALKHVGLLTRSPRGCVKNALLIIDTYSQTAAGDEKSVVSPYIKHLRDLIEQAEQSGGSLSVVVIDHFTKSGSSFMGAQAKLGDSDGMIEIERRGDRITVSCPTKMKSGRLFEPIHLALAPFVLDGYLDPLGRPLSSLIVKPAEGAALRPVAETVLQLLADAGDSCRRDELRNQFVAHPANVGKNADSVKRAFSRAIDDLMDDGRIAEVDGVVQNVTPDGLV